MKKYILLLVVILCFTASCKINEKLNFSSLELNHYYKATINNNKIFLFIEKNETDSLKGHFFVVENKALVTKLPFSARINKKNLHVNYSYNNEINKLKIKLLLTNDSSFIISLNHPQTKTKTQIEFIKETLQPKFISNNRYKNKVFSNHKVTTHIYGNALGYYASKPVDVVDERSYPSIVLTVSKNLAKNMLMKNLDLDLDLYEPLNDSINKRPLAVLIHGGAFIIGDKAGKTMVELATMLSEMGYVVASVNYRLGYVFIPGMYSYLERCMYRATQDVRAAIRFLVSNADNFGIDSSKIYVAGNSAGGITALNVALMNDNNRFASARGDKFSIQSDLGCLDCSSNNIKVNFRVKAIVNMWGALPKLQMLVENNIPILSIHGDKDFVVPIDTEYPFANVNRELSSIFTTKMHGSRSIDKYCQVLNINCKFVELKNVGHDPHINPDNSFNHYFDTVKYHTRKFLHQQTIYDNCNISGTNKINNKSSIVSYKIDCPIYNPYWEINGGKIIYFSEKSDSIKVVWFNNESSHNLKLHYLNINNAVVNKNIDINIFP